MLPKFLKEMYPFTSRYMPLETGAKLHYIEEGKGETVLFLHGHPTWSFFFRNLILSIRADFRCIAIDHVGYGLSDKPMDYNYTTQQHIQDTIRFVEKKQFKKFHIVGHDFGVAIMLALAERWPERISSMSVMNSSLWFKAIPPLITVFKLPLVGALLTIPFNLLPRACASFGINDVVASEVVKGYIWPYRHLKDRIGIYKGTQDIPWMASHPTLETLETIAHKTYILGNKKTCFFWADRDFRYPFQDLKSWANILPNATYKRYPIAGDYLLEDSAKALNDMKMFLYKCRNIGDQLYGSRPSIHALTTPQNP